MPQKWAKDWRDHFDPKDIKPQWYHPLLRDISHVLSKQELQSFSYEYYLKFLPFFRNQPEGSLAVGVSIEFTKKMKQKLGLAFLFEHKIKLNQNYFATDPALLPYTLFHEMTHLWLYNCLLDPGHTRRFYSKMKEFEQTGLPLDPDVHIHRRIAPEAKHVYSCPNCDNRWFMREKPRRKTYCGHCYDKNGLEYFVQPYSRPMER